MNLPIHHPLADAAAAAAKNKASPEHKRFQSLLAQIERARQRLQTWQQQLPVFAEMHAASVAPAMAKLAATRRALVVELDALHADKRWTKAERATMSDMIAGISEALLDAADEPDAELASLHDRHADVAYDAQEQVALASMQAMFEDLGGFDFGDAPIESADDLFQRAHEQVAQRQRPPPDQAESAFESRPRKPPRQSAAQKRAAEEAHRVSQTVREVYRKLASALHPDRTPADATDEERARRVAQMQRANTAYEAADLLALLELQLQIEQVDVAHAAGIAAEQVRHFNKLLSEQLRELHAEIDGRQQALCNSYGLLTDRRLDPDKLGAVLKDELRELSAAQLLAEMQRHALNSGPADGKRMLKQWRKAQRAFEDDFFF